MCNNAAVSHGFSKQFKCDLMTVSHKEKGNINNVFNAQEIMSVINCVVTTGIQDKMEMAATSRLPIENQTQFNLGMTLT